MTTYVKHPELQEGLQAISSIQESLAQAVLDLFAKSVERNSFEGCSSCELAEICGQNNLYCGNAVRGLLGDQEWKPQKPEGGTKT